MRIQDRCMNGPVLVCQIWPAIIGAVGSIAGGLIGSSGQSSANRMNWNMFQQQRQDAYQMARNQMDFNSSEAAIQRGWTEHMYGREQAYATQMANTEVRRRIEDLKAAGLNPMLAYQGQASSPNPSAGAGSAASASGGSPQRGPEVRNEKQAIANAVMQATSAYSSIKAQDAQTERTKEETRTQEEITRKAAADASIAEAAVPYSAQNAQVQSLTMDRQFQKLGVEIEKAIVDRDLAKLDYEELKPLVIKYQSLINEAEKLGLSEKRATSKIFENDVGGWLKWTEIVRRVMPSVNIGRR